MSDVNLNQIDEKGKAPKTRIIDAKSLNAVVQKILEADYGSALARQDVQASLDGKAPYDEEWMRQTGQEGRANLNFLDLKRRVKREEMGYYDLTESVPVLGIVNGPLGMTPVENFKYYMVMSEEFHRMLKDWSSFEKYHQLLCHKFCGHGIGFLYFEDDLNWKWRVAGLEDFKVPRGTSLAEEELDMAIVYRDVTVATLYQWCESADPSDKRWNRQEVYKAILKAYNSNLVFNMGEWEKYQQVLKNNDLYVVNTAQEFVKLAHCWVREYSGKVSQYLTLRHGGNEDFLFKCEGRYDNINQCFNFFPYEVGTNGTLHSVRGLAHERFPMAQVLNTLRNQGVDNARLAGSLLLQPKSATEAEDLAIIFYGGFVYLPPEVQVQNGNLGNPSATMLPVIQDMSFLLRDDTPNLERTSAGAQPEKTRFQVQKESLEEAVLPAASLNLFYQPWKRHLNEVWRRVRNRELKTTLPGGQEVADYRKRCRDRGVPDEVLFSKDTYIEPMRAVGSGSPGMRLMMLDEFMQYFGSLDAVGQNNLLRDRFAQHVGYAQVDRYVPQISENGRMPYDAEIADLQNAAMSGGTEVSVNPNDNHILHLQSHLPSLEQDLGTIESSQSNPQLVHVAVIKTKHAAQHIQMQKPDKLNKQIVMELGRKFNNLAERTSAAVDRLERDQARQAQQQRQAELEAAKQQGAAEVQPQVDKTAMDLQAHSQKINQAEEAHQQTMAHREQDQKQKLALRDAETAVKLNRPQ